MKRKQEISPHRKIELLSKTSLTRTEVMELLACGYPKVNQLRSQLERAYDISLGTLIPTSLIVKHEHIDIDLIIKLSQS